MSAFMKQYGRTMLLAAAAVLVLGAAFGIKVKGKTGFIEAACGTAMEDLDLTAEGSLAVADAVKAAAARSRPEITFGCTKILPQTEVDLTAMLTASDADGRQISCEILEIWDEDGQSLLHPAGAVCDPSRLLFPSAGVYVMEVKAVDAEQKTAQVQFQIPVTTR